MSLLSLPEEVVCYIGNFLKLPDLLALSATCQRLRSALNCNSVWRKYSGGGAISQALKSVTSIVKPTFTDPQDITSTLDPLCEQRVNFLRQNHLFNNYSNGKFVQYSIPFANFAMDNFKLWCSDSQITYKDQYLFVLGYCYGELFKEVKVYNIEEAPCLLVTFKLLKHEKFPGYTVKLKVVENKLVIHQDHWFDVYEIKLPGLEFPLLHSIDVTNSPSVRFSDKFLVKDYIILENHILLENSCSTSDTVQMWNVSTGTRLDDIKPKIEGSYLRICNHPGDKQDILFSVEVTDGRGPFITSHLFVYSLETLQYTNFYAVLPLKSDSTNPDYFGLIGAQHVVLLHELLLQERAVEAFVYDINSSALLARKSMKVTNKRESFIVNGYLALRKLSTVVMVSLSKLETVWKIDFGAPIPFYESRIGIRCYDMLGLKHFILVETSASIEVWNFENRRKCFDLPNSIRFVVMSNSHSKLVVLNNDVNLETLSFW